MAQSAETRCKRVGPQSVIAPSSPARKDPCALANFPTWQRRRAGLLHRLFLRVESRMNAGESLRESLRQFVWRWQNRKLDTKHSARFAYQTLRCLFYFWRRSGRTAEALLLRYRSGSSKVQSSLLADFVDTCGSLGVESMAQAWRYNHIAHGMLWPGPGPEPEFPSYTAFMRALTSEQRRAILDLQAANKAAERARARFKATFPPSD